jgi:choline dehydrogenase
VQLITKAADEQPRIDLGLLSDERDVQLILQGLKLARRVLNSEPFALYKGRESLPGAAVTDDQALIEFIRNNCGTTFHPVGTCAMGSGPNHVVDARLAVHGIEGLRVIDASIMPTQIGGNTNGPTVMIAEKAADLILASG